MPAVESQPASTSTSIIPHVFLHVWDSFTTQFNKFDIAHAYCHCLSHNPDMILPMDELSRPSQPIIPSFTEGPCGNYSPSWPWSNMSIWHLMTWKTTGSTQCCVSQQTCVKVKGLLTLRKVLTKRCCILKEVLGLRTRDKGTGSQPDELWICKTDTVIA